MARFAIVDLKNLYTRAVKAAGVRVNAFDKAGMGLYTTFRSIRKMVDTYKIDHVVICAEGKSWRYDYYPEYKANRRLLRAQMTAAEREEDAIIFDTFNQLVEYLRDQTRMTVLSGSRAEGDDYVARFIQLHNRDEHVILSSDSDFIQLLAPNVTIFDAMLERLIDVEGVTNLEGDPLFFWIDGGSGKLKVREPIPEAKQKHETAELDKKKEKAAKGKDYEPIPFEFNLEPEWWREALFVKIIRGDSGDGIFSSYPRVFYKGTKKQIGIQQAWADRETRGYVWNNFMQSKWEKLTGSTSDGDPLTEDVVVKDEFAINEMLIDLTKQPPEILQLIDEVIIEQLQKPKIPQVGVGFLRFCGKHNLPTLGQEVGSHAAYLNAAYPSGDWG